MSYYFSTCVRMSNFDGDLNSGFGQFLIESGDEYPGTGESGENEQLFLSQDSIDNEQEEEEENSNSKFSFSHTELNDNQPPDDECGFNTNSFGECS